MNVIKKADLPTESRNVHPGTNNDIPSKAYGQLMNYIGVA